MEEHMEMRGQLTIRLTDHDGNIILEQRHKNRIVRTGRRLVAQLFGGVSGGVPPNAVTHMGVGTDGTAVTDDDTSLHAERARNPLAGAVVYEDFDEIQPPPAPVIKRVRARLTAEFDFNEAVGPDPLREAAIFSAATGGVMYNRVVFDPVAKTNAFKLTLLWDVVF